MFFLFLVRALWLIRFSLLLRLLQIARKACGFDQNAFCEKKIFKKFFFDDQQ